MRLSREGYNRIFLFFSFFLFYAPTCAIPRAPHLTHIRTHSSHTLPFNRIPFPSPHLHRSNCFPIPFKYKCCNSLPTTIPFHKRVLLPSRINYLLSPQLQHSSPIKPALFYYAHSTSPAVARSLQSLPIQPPIKTILFHLRSASTSAPVSCSISYTAPLIQITSYFCNPLYTLLHTQPNPYSLLLQSPPRAFFNLTSYSSVRFASAPSARSCEHHRHHMQRC